MIGFLSGCWRGGRNSLFLGPRVRRLRRRGWIGILVCERRVRIPGGLCSMVTMVVLESLVFFEELLSKMKGIQELNEN